MNQAHAMMPHASHDERAEQLFIRDFKTYLQGLSGTQKAIAESMAATMAKTADKAPDPDDFRDAMMAQPVYRSWISFRRTSQEMLWDAIGSSVDRQINTIAANARVAEPKGSLHLNPDLLAPDYLAQTDVHMMPGGYTADHGNGDVRQGAVMDRGGAVYMLGRNGGLMNDARGHALVSHVFDRAPDIQPQRTLELGCGVGASAAAVASYFPKAENWGIDVGAALLRYAHARAEHLGVGIHFDQQNAESTSFPDNHFDLVYSCVVLHETGPEAARAIIAESHRILKPGGLMAHLEVPSNYKPGDLWDELQGDFEQRYNNEPFWRGANTIDYRVVVEEAGFRDVMVGYQATRPRAERGAQGFSLTNSGVFRCWFVVSGVK